MWETAIHQVKCTHVKHEKNINESRRENVQNERKLRRKTKVTAQRCWYTQCTWIYMIWIMFKIKFLSDMSDVFILYLHNNIYDIKESQQFPQKYAGKLINSVEKPFFSFCTQVRYIRQKKSSVDFYSVFPFWTSKTPHTRYFHFLFRSRNFLKWNYKNIRIFVSTLVHTLCFVHPFPNRMKYKENVQKFLVQHFYGFSFWVPWKRFSFR